MKNTDLDNQILLQQSTHYEKYHKIDSNPRYRKAWSYILDKYPDGGSVLDVGCTNGDFSKYLIKHNFDCSGLEFMDQAIKQSKKAGLHVTKGSFLNKFPYKDNSFNIVFAGEVIEHTVDDDFFLQEVRRVLKPGGLLILTTPNLVSLGNRFLMMFGKMPRFAYAEFHYRIYNKQLIISKIFSSKMKLLKIESNYVLISTFFNKLIGTIGEWLGSLLPEFGENFIVYAQKKGSK